jgi:hypothetical protein
VERRLAYPQPFKHHLSEPGITEIRDDELSQPPRMSIRSGLHRGSIATSPSWRPALAVVAGAIVGLAFNPSAPRLSVF